MNGIGKQAKDFVGYEYKEVTIESNKVSFMIDGYENFGWEADGNMIETTMMAKLSNQNKVILHMKRNRKILNKMELTRLQRNFEACVSEIDAMEKSKGSKATMYALIVGILGTACMAGATFAITAQSPHIILCIILAIPGFIGWILPYFLYRNTIRKQTARLTPLIEEKYDEIYEICAKGNKLLY